MMAPCSGVVLEAKFKFHLNYSSGFHKAVQELNIPLIGPSHILDGLN